MLPYPHPFSAHPDTRVEPTERSSRRLILGPQGSPPPRAFQRAHPIEDAE